MIVISMMMMSILIMMIRISSQTGAECLEWKEAIDGGDVLPGVGIDGIIYDHNLDDKKRHSLVKIKEGTSVEE